jgi:hypothetical protein
MPWRLPARVPPWAGGVPAAAIPCIGSSPPAAPCAPKEGVFADPAPPLVPLLP